MIRKVIESDFPYIYDLGNSLINNYDKLYNLKKILDYKSHFLKVYVENNKIIGFVEYTVSVDEADIIAIIISQAYRHNGIGSQLMYAIIDEKNIKKLNVEVREDNKEAIDFYKKLGFIKIRIIKNYYQNTNAIFMIKMLNKE